MQQTVNAIEIENFKGTGYVLVMENTNKKPSKGFRYRIAGITRDGVRILSNGPATHFTEKEIRKIMSTVHIRSLAGSVLTQNPDRGNRKS